MEKGGSRRMVLVLGVMVFWANGDNYVAAPLIVEIAKAFHLDIGRLTTWQPAGCRRQKRR